MSIKQVQSVESPAMLGNGLVRINLLGLGWAVVQLKLETYVRGGRAVRLVLAEDFQRMDDEPWYAGEPLGILSVWCAETPNLPADVFYLKSWNENESIAAQLLELGVILPAYDCMPSRSTSAIPVRLNPRALALPENN